MTKMINHPVRKIQKKIVVQIRDTIVSRNNILNTNDSVLVYKYIDNFCTCDICIRPF